MKISMSMATVPIFRNGKWYEYSLPDPIDPMWSTSHRFQAAAFYVNALSRDFTAKESASITIAYMNKEIYKGLQYNVSLEQMIKKIKSPLETT